MPSLQAAMHMLVGDRASSAPSFIRKTAPSELFAAAQLFLLIKEALRSRNNKQNVPSLQAVMHICYYFLAELEIKNL